MADGMNGLPNLGWVLLLVGLLLAGIGLLWLLLPSVPWLGRLPGDVRIERDNFRFYLPLMTSLLLSLVLTVLFWLIRWLRG